MSILTAGNTGKIAGNITDSKNGEPLIGVDVVIKGTYLGSVTDDNGEFFVLNLPAESYTLQISMIGYETVTINNVVVHVDQTTRISQTLTQSVIAGQEVNVLAERPVIKKDVTSTQTTVGEEELRSMPVQEVQDVLKTVAGAVSDGETMHIRGGRSNELAFLLDGVPVNDPMHGRAGQLVSTGSVEEMVVVTGTYNAEYGNAMSGVVNVVTKRGSNDFHGRFRYFSGHPGSLENFLSDDRWSSAAFYDTTKYADRQAEGLPLYIQPEESIYDEDSTVIGFKDINGNGEQDDAAALIAALESSLENQMGDLNRFELALNGPIIKDRVFFNINLDGNKDAGWIPGTYSNHSGLFSDDSPLGSMFFKLTVHPTENINLFASYHQATRNWKDYNHFFKYMVDRVPVQTEETSTQTLGFTFQFSRSTYMDGSVAFYNNDFSNRLFDTFALDAANGPYFGTFTPRYDGPNEFSVGGYDPVWVSTQTARTIAQFSVNSQVNNFNLLKAGFSYIGNQLDKESHTSLDFYDYLDEKYKYEPTELSLYLQDKIEWGSLILNMGFRYDSFNPSASYWEDPRDGGDDSKSVKTSVKNQFSPRLGFSHPITNRSVIHFAYGHFFQIPDYTYLYWNLSNASGYTPMDIDKHSPVVGNPDLDPQKTVAIEVGWEQQLGKAIRLDVTTFQKDITDMIATRLERVGTKGVTRYVNADYGTVKGVEVSLDNRITERFNVSIDYTLSLAEGNSSDVFDAFYDLAAEPPEVIPKRSMILDWDQRHTLNYTVAYETAGKHIFTGGWKFSLLGVFGSGLPYTAQNIQGLRIGDRNGERKPSTHTVDLYVTKKLPFAGAELFAEVTNLLNKQNIMEVDPTTGLPDQSLWPQSTEDGTRDPSNFGDPRKLMIGVDISW